MAFDAQEWLTKRHAVVAVGDAITIVWLMHVIDHTRPIVMNSFVTKIGPTGDFAVQYPMGTDNLKREGEGVEWLRGHHAIDSAEVKALLAAKAL